MGGPDYAYADRQASLNVNTGKIENAGVEAQVAYRFVPSLVGRCELQLFAHG